MRDTAEYKAMAREALRGRYGTIIAASLISSMSVGLLAYIFNLMITILGFPVTGMVQEGRLSGGWVLVTIFCIAAAALFFLTLILQILFQAGSIKLVFKAGRREIAALSDMLYGFTGSLPLRLSVLFFLQLLVYLLPAAAAAVVIGAAVILPMILALRLLLILAGILLYILGMFVVVLSFGFSQYILVDFPHLTAFQAMKASLRLMKGRRLTYLWLTLTFAGWWVLLLCTAGLGQLWYMPYSMCTYYFFYEDLKAEKQLDFLN